MADVTPAPAWRGPPLETVLVCLAVWISVIIASAMTFVCSVLAICKGVGVASLVRTTWLDLAIWPVGLWMGFAVVFAVAAGLIARDALRGPNG